MWSTFTNAVGMISRGRPANFRPAPHRQVRLNVETMEERMVLSTSPMSLPAPITEAPAKVREAVPVAPESKGGEIIIPISPERAVHGYKWRPPRSPYDPRAITPATEHIPTIALAHIEGAQVSEVQVLSPGTTEDARLQMAMDKEVHFLQTLAKFEQQLSATENSIVKAMK